MSIPPTKSSLPEVQLGLVRAKARAKESKNMGSESCPIAKEALSKIEDILQNLTSQVAELQRDMVQLKTKDSVSATSDAKVERALEEMKATQQAQNAALQAAMVANAQSLAVLTQKFAYFEQQEVERGARIRALEVADVEMGNKFVKIGGVYATVVAIIAVIPVILAIVAAIRAPEAAAAPKGPIPVYYVPAPASAPPAQHP